MNSSKILDVVKKPLPAKAFQWKGVSEQSKKDLLQFLNHTGCTDLYAFTLTEHGLSIETLEGQMRVDTGAYII
ncbi:hypothetical protein [Listeria booriae]|nr:hypothetical protein [Listeria booriae]MBC1333434.1 hypothetical protein [Listeria booriae]MBC2388740.1 hypothetical protein [Listeria booriae]